MEAKCEDACAVIAAPAALFKGGMFQGKHAEHVTTFSRPKTDRNSLFSSLKQNEASSVSTELLIVHLL